MSVEGEYKNNRSAEEGCEEGRKGAECENSQNSSDFKHFARSVLNVRR